MDVLLAGPGTGKTTNIKKILSNHGVGGKFLILSFTNATVSDLLNSLKPFGVTEKNCMTLHKFAIKHSHVDNRHILLNKEEEILKKISSSKNVNVDFNRLCDFLQCTTFDQMIDRITKYAKSNPLYFKDMLTNYDSLIIDEYQDFNPIEQDLLDVLIDNINRTYLLGDDDQCIYDFKDSSSDRIIQIYNDKNNTKIEHDHKCYRCADKIVEHATNLILENKKRVQKSWQPSGRKGNIIYSQLYTLNDVADSILNTLEVILPRIAVHLI